METAIAQQTTPTDLIAQAIAQPDFDIEKLERLLAMKERWDKEQARMAFTEALSKFQDECPDLRKTKSVKFKSDGPTVYNYAPLADIDRQIKALMKKHGFTKNWKMFEMPEKKIKVICIITHVQGHSEETEMEAEADMSGQKNPIQGKGSAIEYMKRYTLIGALGLTTADSDIDGRLPEMDIDKLHKTYMELYNQITPKKPELSTAMNPDNWAGDRSPELYVQAIAKARKILAGLTTVKP